MISFLVASILLTQDTPRLRVELPNHATVLVERFEHAKTFSIHLIIASKGTEETKPTHGWRHLLEHLVVKGQRGNLDGELESKGLFLTAQTFRDYMAVSIVGRNDRIEEGFRAISEVLGPFQVSAGDLTKEIGIIKSELNITTDVTRLLSASWVQAFGEKGLDPLGDPASMALATPDHLVAFRNAMISGRNVVLAISGSMDAQKMADRGRNLLADLKGTAVPSYVDRGEVAKGRISADACYGELRSVPVGSFIDPDFAAKLIAGMAISLLVPESVITYTFTNRNGILSVARSVDNTGMGTAIDNATAEEVASCFSTARRLARTWLESKLSDPGEHSRLRAILLATETTRLPEEAVDAVNGTTLEQYQRAFEAFKSDHCVIATGGSR